MNANERSKFGELLQNIAASLDIPNIIYEDAVQKYMDIGQWLAAEDSELRSYSPEIYTQGSFRLGTVTLPPQDIGEYDIDLVCHLNISKENTTQARLKEMAGERLKKREDLSKIIKPKRRCWRLEYESEPSFPRFHLDILPAIPNPDSLPTGLLLTDQDLTRWQFSNPIVYADWFYKKIQPRLVELKSAIAKSDQISIDDVPDEGLQE